MDGNGGIVMEQENSKSQQPESGQDEALEEGKSAETEPDAAPPQKKGLLSALKAFFAFLLRLLFRQPLGSASIQEVPCITLELVKEYFQRPKTLKLLKDNKDFLAVAIREKEREGRIVVTLTLYDTQQEEAVMDVELVSYRGERLDQGLEEAFGDKEMIVLQ